MRSYFDGYDEDNLAAGRWLAREKAVMNGRPMLRSMYELEQALLALPRPLLRGSEFAGEDETGEQGEVCALAAYVLWRRQQEKDETYEDALLYVQSIGEADASFSAEVASRYGMTETLAWIIESENDEGWSSDSLLRYDAALRWTRRHIARLEAKFGTRIDKQRTFVADSSHEPQEVAVSTPSSNRTEI